MAWTTTVMAKLMKIFLKMDRIVTLVNWVFAKTASGAVETEHWLANRKRHRPMKSVMA